MSRIRHAKKAIVGSISAAFAASLMLVSVPMVQAGAGSAMQGQGVGAEYARACKTYVKRYCSDPKSRAEGVNQCLFEVQDLISKSCQREVLRMEIARGALYR